MQRMKGRHVVITGGCGGIGGACVETFVREGASVHIIDMVRNEPLLTQLSDRARFTEMDVSVEAQWQSLTQELDQGAPVDVLVNAAGISGLKNIEDADFAWWQRFQRINADSIFLSIHYLLPWLRAAPSAAIVNIGSTCAIRPTADLPAYSASKSAVRSLTKSVALHCAEKGLPYSLQRGASRLYANVDDGSQFGNHGRRARSQPAMANGCASVCKSAGALDATPRHRQRGAVSCK